MDDEHAGQNRPQNPVWDSSLWLINFLGSVPFAIIVIALITIACIVGTLLPQGDAVAKYLLKNPDGKVRMELFGLLGLTRVYSAAWFLALLGLLSASLAACTFRRYGAVRRAHGRARGRAIGSVLTHISLLLVLTGGVIRGVWGERGNLEFRETQTRQSFHERGEEKPLPFSVHLVKFEIEMHPPPQGQDEAANAIQAERLLVVWPQKHTRSALTVEIDKEQWVVPEGAAAGGPSALRINVLRRVPDFIIDMQTREVSSRSDEPRNPAILVETLHAAHTNEMWVFANHPDFNMHTTDSHDAQKPPFKLLYQIKTRPPEPPRVKDYKSTLQIIEDGEIVREKTIEVNLPLRYGGYTFYQSGYNPRDPKWTSLQVVKDPGVPLVYAGFFLMIAGLATVFYLYPQKRPGIAAQRSE